MRRPVRVKSDLGFLLDKLFSLRRVATVATLPSALSMSVFLVRSVQVRCSRYSRCCHLLGDLSPISTIGVGPGH